jgi:CheY-specific phosphatase CheX
MMMSDSEFLSAVENELSLAARGIFQTLLSEELQIRRETKFSFERRFDYSAIVQFGDVRGQGVLRLGFPTGTMLRLTNALLGETATVVSESNCDAVAEILNMLYGTARTRLNSNGYEFLPAIPTLERAAVRPEIPNWSHGVTLEFETSHGPFNLVIGAQLRERSAA